jgi:putative DNA-invertase from lambdoid prophage Rac
VSVVAQLERDLIRERVTPGIRNARASGNMLGWPIRTVDLDRILEMRAEGQTVGQIAENLGIGYGTVRARLQNKLAKNPGEKRPRKRTEKDT